MRKIFFGFIILIAFIACSCSFYNRGGEEGYRITNINIYKDTDAWELAKAVKNQDTNKIEKIAVKNPELLDYQDSKYGATLLVWSVGMEKYKSAEALLKCGADPDIISKYDGGTALYLAAGFSWVDNKAKTDPKYVQLLLEYGADPNINYVGREDFLTIRSGIKGRDGTALGTSPLMRSIGCGLEKTKALVEAGAEVDYKASDDQTAAIIALYYWGGAEYAHYLIVENNASIVDPYYITLVDDSKDKVFYPVDLMREWTYELDSNDYRLKMEIVDEFAWQGVDYWSTEIHWRKLEQIQYMYPETWEEYIKKY